MPRKYDDFSGVSELAVRETIMQQLRMGWRPAGPGCMPAPPVGPNGSASSNSFAGVEGLQCADEELPGAATPDDIVDAASWEYCQSLADALEARSSDAEPTECEVSSELFSPEQPSTPTMVDEATSIEVLSVVGESASCMESSDQLVVADEDRSIVVLVQPDVSEGDGFVVKEGLKTNYDFVVHKHRKKRHATWGLGVSCCNVWYCGTVEKPAKTAVFGHVPGIVDECPMCNLRIGMSTRSISASRSIGV